MITDILKLRVQEFWYVIGVFFTCYHFVLLHDHQRHRVILVIIYLDIYLFIHFNTSYVYILTSVTRFSHMYFLYIVDLYTFVDDRHTLQMQAEPLWFTLFDLIYIYIYMCFNRYSYSYLSLFSQSNRGPMLLFADGLIYSRQPGFQYWSSNCLGGYLRNDSWLV